MSKNGVFWVDITVQKNEFFRKFLFGLNVHKFSSRVGVESFFGVKSSRFRLTPEFRLTPNTHGVQHVLRHFHYITMQKLSIIPNLTDHKKQSKTNPMAYLKNF